MPTHKGLHCYSSCLPLFLTTTKLFSISVILSFKNITWNHTQVTFGSWLFPLNIILRRSIKVVPISKRLFFLLLGSIPWYGGITACLTIHILQDIWIDSRILAITNKGAMNICLQILHNPKFSFPLNKCPIVQFPGLYGKCMFYFWQRTAIRFYLSAYTIHIPTEVNGNPVSLHPCRHLLSLFFILAILMGVQGYIIVVLNCIFPNALMIATIFSCVFTYVYPFH